MKLNDSSLTIRLIYFCQFSVFIIMCKHVTKKFAALVLHIGTSRHWSQPCRQQRRFVSGVYICAHHTTAAEQFLSVRLQCGSEVENCMKYWATEKYLSTLCLHLQRRFYANEKVSSQAQLSQASLPLNRRRVMLLNTAQASDGSPKCLWVWCVEANFLIL